MEEETESDDRCVGEEYTSEAFPQAVRHAAARRFGCRQSTNTSYFGCDPERIKWAHHLSRAAWSLSNLAHMLRLNLFTYRDFMQWLHNPFGTPPLTPEPEQLLLMSSPLGHPIDR